MWLLMSGNIMEEKHFCWEPSFFSCSLREIENFLRMNSCDFRLSVSRLLHSFSKTDHNLVLGIMGKFYCFSYKELYRARQEKLSPVLLKELEGFFKEKGGG